MGDGQPVERSRERNAKMEAAAAPEGIAHEVEDLVAADAGEGNDRRAVAERGPDEAVTASPQQSIAELARLQRFAEPARKDEEELTGLQDGVGVLLGAVDDAGSAREAPDERDGVSPG
jgi:hypothetical protein